MLSDWVSASHHLLMMLLQSMPTDRYHECLHGREEGRDQVGVGPLVLEKGHELKCSQSLKTGAGTGSELARLPQLCSKTHKK